MTTPGQGPVASVAEAAERSHFALRRAVVDVAMSLLRAGVLSHSGHADLSARVGPDTVLIATLNRTRDLVPDDLAVVRLDGTVAEGDLGGMSTEVVAMHTEVYLARPQAGAVIHTHSPHLLAFALAGRPLPARYEPLPRLGQAEEVPVAPSASAVIELIGARPGTQAVLLGGHGVLAFGPDAETTVSLLVALEEAAEAELRTAVLGRLSAPLDRAGHRRDPARTERLEPGQRALAVDRGHHRQRHRVPGLREGRVPQRRGGSRPPAARAGAARPAARAPARHHGRGHPALVGTLTGPAGSAADPQSTMVKGWKSAFAS
jgi:L-ribulose-5-phosphate 4-epimerase